MHILFTRRLSKFRDVNKLAKNNVPAKKETGLKNIWTRGKEYLISVYNELKKVHWPNRMQLVGYTGVVLFTVVVVALILWIFDTGLSFLLKQLFTAFA